MLQRYLPDFAGVCPPMVQTAAETPVLAPIPGALGTSTVRNGYAPGITTPVGARREGQHANTSERKVI
jgi:hypothetical protein